MSNHHHKHIVYEPKNNPYYKDAPELFKAKLLTRVTCYDQIHSPISKSNSISKPDTFYIILKLHKLPRLLKDTLSKISFENISDAVASLNNSSKIYRWTKLPKVLPAGRLIVSGIGTLNDLVRLQSYKS